jgi:hypothetical protein
LPAIDDSPEEFLAAAGLVRELTRELEQRGELTALRPPVTVLVVAEDEMARTLRRDGYNVIEADGPSAALRLCAEYPGAIHLLLSGTEQPELRERAPALRPDMEIVCLSGEPAACDF